MSRYGKNTGDGKNRRALSAERDAERHHDREPGREEENARVGMPALGHLRYELLHDHVDHRAGSEGEKIRHCGHDESGYEDPDGAEDRLDGAGQYAEKKGAPFARGRRKATEEKRIKTRETAPYIRTLERSAGTVRRAGSRVRNAAAGTERAEESVPEEYAVRETERAAEETVRKSGSAAGNIRGRINEGLRYGRRERYRHAGDEAAGGAAGRTYASARRAGRTVKTAERTSRVTVKTSKAAARAAGETAKASAKAAKTASAMAKKAAVASYKAAVAAGKAVSAAAKEFAAAVKSLAAAVAAGGWAAVVVVAIAAVAVIAVSAYGIFFAGDAPDGGLSLRDAVHEINAEYLAELEAAEVSQPHDVLETSGSAAVWREVLAVYAVKTAADPEDPREVATLDAEKTELLRNVFWEMNSVETRTVTETVTIIIESDDGHGNVVEEETEEERTTLYVTVSHRTAEETAELYGFTADQTELLEDMLRDEYASVWAWVLYGIRPGAGADLVAVALSQLGNPGGRTYWSWYGFSSRVDWCACFVSWCADECGYLDQGVLPKYAGCTAGAAWFRDRGRWLEGGEEPAEGMIIFFDWDDPEGPNGEQDGAADHTGIVVDVSDGIVHTVEGNSGDAVRRKSYPVGWYEILGYGVPAY